MYITKHKHPQLFCGVNFLQVSIDSVEHSERSTDNDGSILCDKSP